MPDEINTIDKQRAAHKGQPDSYFMRKTKIRSGNKKEQNSHHYRHHAAKPQIETLHQAKVKLRKLVRDILKVSSENSGNVFQFRLMLFVIRDEK